MKQENVMRSWIAWTQLQPGVVIALLTVYLVWGSTYLAIKVALQSFPPFLMTGARFLLAGTVLFVWLRFRAMPLPTRVQWRNAALIGALLLAGGVGGTAFAEQWIHSGLAAVSVATIPLWTALFTGLFGRWPTRFEWLGIGIGFLGVALLNLEGTVRAQPLGALALLLATLSWSFGSVISQRLTLPRGSTGFAAEMLAGGVVLVVIGLLRGERLVEPVVGAAVAAWLYLVFAGSLVAFSAYMYLLSRVRPTLATSYAYVNPLIAVGLGVGLGGETITGIGIAAMVVIILGVGFMALGRE